MPIQSQFYYAPDVNNLFYITCEEIFPSFEPTDSLLTDNDYKFYDDQTQKFYKIKREFVCLSMVANLFNQTFFNFDSKLNNQQQPQFTKEYEDNFEFHFKQFLIERIFNQNENMTTCNTNTFLHDNNQGNNHTKFSGFHFENENIVNTLRIIIKC